MNNLLQQSKLDKTFPCDCIQLYIVYIVYMYIYNNDI